MSGLGAAVLTSVTTAGDVVDTGAKEMQRPLVPLFLLLAATTLPALAAEYHLESCGADGGSLIDDVLCDPDHLVQPDHRKVIIEVLTRCGEDTGHRLLLFLAATLPHDVSSSPHRVSVPAGDATLITTPMTSIMVTTKQSSGYDGGYGHGGESRDITHLQELSSGDDGGDSRGITHLKELVVAANNLTTSSSPVILLIGVKDQFQMATWWSDSLSGVLTSATIHDVQLKASGFMDHEPFIDATVKVAYYLCQSAQSSDNAWPVRRILLTVTWIAFTACFVILLVAIAVILIKARIKAQKTRAEKGRVEVAGQRASRLTFPRVSDTHDWSQVSFKSTGHVLLGTTDVTAVLAQDSSSTDNLLDNC